MAASTTAIWKAQMERRVDALEKQMLNIVQQEGSIMATEQDLQNSLDGIQTGLGQVGTRIDDMTKAIADLKAQIAAGTPVSQEQLDALATEAAGILTTVTGLAAPAA